MSEPRHVHTIPVPAGWSIEQAWTAIQRGDQLTHSQGRPTWVNVEADEAGMLIRVLPSGAQIRERATDLAKSAGVADELDGLTERLAMEAAAQAAERNVTIDVYDLAGMFSGAMQQAVGEILDQVDPRPAA